MSERMTDEEVTNARRIIQGALATHRDHDVADIARESLVALAEAAKTARASEEQKDAAIKALADALLRNGFWVDGGKDWHARRCPQSLPPAGAPCTCPDDRQALRIAGRL